VDIRRWAKAPSRRDLALSAAVLVVGLSATAGAASTLTHAAHDAATDAFHLRTAGVRNALDTTFQRYADTMHDLVAAAATQPAGTLDPTVARLVGQRLPGVHQVRVVGADSRVTAQFTADGSTPLPETTLVAERELVQVMGRARLSGRLVASGAHVLPRDLDLPPAHRRPGFVLAAPITTAPVGATGPEFRGWVLISVRADDLLETSLRTAGVTGVAAALSESSPRGTAQHVATWSQGGPVTGDRAETVDVALAGHAWQIVVRPTTDLVPDGRALASTATTALGALASLLLAALVLALTGARTRADHRAARAVERADAAGARALAAEAALYERDAELVGFAAVAGENLQAPLTTIAGFTDLLQEEAGPQMDDASRGFLDRISRSTHRMLGVVDELLAYTAATDAALRPEPVDAAQLATGIVAEHLGTLSGGTPSGGFHHDDRPSIDVGDLPTVTADADLLRQVLDQFIGNAVRFVRHGSAARVTVGARRTGDGWWRIEVADRGIGVPEEHREKIFTPFHRAPAAEGFPGSGLGLAICRRIVSLHGGRIGVEANPGGGSAFWFTVPDGGTPLSAGERPYLAAEPA
jgi:signal transduction histidine kinase